VAGLGDVAMQPWAKAVQAEREAKLHQDDPCPDACRRACPPAIHLLIDLGVHLRKGQAVAALIEASRLHGECRVRSVFAGCGFEPGKPLHNINQPRTVIALGAHGFAIFAIVDHRNPGVDLAADDFLNGRAQPLPMGAWVTLRFRCRFETYREQFVRARQGTCVTTTVKTEEEP
jgi:hypothetical protein